MSNLFNMTSNQFIFFIILIVVITGCVVTLIKVLETFINKAHMKKLETKAGTVTFSSPHDRIRFHTMELDEPTHVDLGNIEDWEKHPFFSLLKTMQAKGVRVTTRSTVKSQFINEYVKIYAETFLSELRRWVELVIRSEGKELGNVIFVMSAIEEKCQDELRRARIKISYEQQMYYLQVPEILIEKMINSYSVSQSAGFTTLEVSLDSKFFDGWQNQLNVILLQLYTITSTNFVGMNTAIKTLNGELDEYFQTMTKQLSKEWI